MAFISSNPYTGEKYGEYPYISDGVLEQKLRYGESTYYDFWRDLDVRERAKRLSLLTDLLLKDLDTYAAIITEEMGKPLKEAKAEVKKVTWLIDYYVKNAPDFLKPKEIETEYKKSYLRFDPLGGILGIMPWNYPFWQVYRWAVPTLLAGNTVFLKHAPNVPRCALAIEKTFAEATGEEGVFQNLFVDIPQVDKIMSDTFIRGVSLTGSERAGSAVGALAGKNIKKAVLELGGNDPFIICKNADLDKALDQFVISRMSNNGQICIAAKRLLVHKEIYPEAKSLLIEKVAALKTGAPTDPDADITCLAREDLKQNLNRQVANILEIGGLLLYEGEKHSGASCMPMVFEVENGLDFDYDEEIFGPVAIMIPFASKEELLLIANSSKYGLAASIWSEDIRHAEKIAAKLEAGNIAINKMVASDPRIPFGGIKRSGFGREMGEEGIKEFVNIKAVVVG